MPRHDPTPKTLADRVQALAEGIPESALQTLLRAFMPVRIATTRPPESPKLVDPLDRLDAHPTPDPFRVSPRVRTRVPRIYDREYEVLTKWHGARSGSKRAVQLDIVFAHTSVRTARMAGAEQVDISFALSQGFIKWKDS